MFQTKEPDKLKKKKKKNFNEMEVRNLPDKEFKLMVIKVLINKNG